MKTKKKLAETFVNYAAKTIEEQLGRRMTVGNKTFSKCDMIDSFSTGWDAAAKLISENAIKTLRNILSGYIHGGDTDCIIREFSERISRHNI